MQPCMKGSRCESTDTGASPEDAVDAEGAAAPGAGGEVVLDESAGAALAAGAGASGAGGGLLPQPMPVVAPTRSRLVIATMLFIHLLLRPAAEPAGRWAALARGGEPRRRA